MLLGFWGDLVTEGEFLYPSTICLSSVCRLSTSLSAALSVFPLPSPSSASVSHSLVCVAIVQQPVTAGRVICKRPQILSSVRQGTPASIQT